MIAVAVSKSTSIPGAFTLAWHPPAIWFGKLSAAYKASGRTQPIFDTLGYIPHPTDSTERPWTKHPGSSAISLGDYDTLMTTLTNAFRGTGQPLPSQASPTIWYLTQGYQTAPDPARAGSFTGSETDPSPLPSWSPAEAADTGTGPGLDQPVQLADAIKVAYCQPSVGAYFNFHLFDERDLAGWQSGVLWPDGTPKAAYQALRRVGRRGERSVDQLRGVLAGRRAATSRSGAAAGSGEARDLESASGHALCVRRDASRGRRRCRRRCRSATV